MLDEPRDAVGERAGLTRARAGDDKRGAVLSSDGGVLLGVELARVVNPQLDGRGEAVELVVARHAVDSTGWERGGEVKTTLCRSGR